MSTIAAIADFLEQLAPLQLAEDWDNVGLLVGHRTRNVRRIMTCLSVTPAVAAEAVESHTDLLVTHHPLPFRANKRVTDETTAGRLLLELIAASVAIYSPHTAFDSAQQGVNELLATGLALRNPAPLSPYPDGLGVGRWGNLDEPLSLGQLAERLKQFLHIQRLQMVGRAEQLVSTVAIGCGAADELLDLAKLNGCDAMMIGEARFHTCLEAQSAGIGLLLPGHFASERFAVERLAVVIAEQFPQIEVWASRCESDPLQWV